MPKQFTALEVFKIAKSNIQERNTSRDFDYDWKTMLNIGLSNLFEVNNEYRLSLNKEPLTEIPYISNNEDVIPYEHQIVLELLVIYLCREFMKDEDLNKYSLFDTQFLNNYQRLVRLGDTTSSSTDDTAE